MEPATNTVKEEKFDEKLEEAATVKTLTAKEIKKLARPEFEANPDKFYPTKVFERIGYTRNRCPKCNAYYWRHTEKADTCGDSQCVGKYKFIGKGTGIGAKGKKITYYDAWKGFEKSLTSARVPCTSIERYPVVARWRNDVDYVAAGIYCFQPFCVTGELDPPANPLICPQFCVRFNDLDNIGLTGRHYSGFIMLGIQVFNYPDKYVFFKEECVEFNHRWLTEELGIDPDEITYIEDVWAGGGNLGPSIEYFVNGLELGNMVFMQYKTFHDGTREELPIKIIDTGIGLERIPWLINGSPTSYFDVFRNALNYTLAKLEMSINNEVWEKIGPYTCLLNIDEVENIDKTWEQISELIGMDVPTIRSAMTPIRDVYIVLDHTRTVMMIIQDGSLPSNVGGGSNVRNILRRVFAIMKRNEWMEKMTWEGFMEIFDHHKKDLEEIYGVFPEYKSFASIIRLEYDKWLQTDKTQRQKLEKLLKKAAVMSIDDWILAMTSWGIPADAIAQISGQQVPGNLYYEIAVRQERVCKAAEVILYNTTHLQETVSIYFDDHRAEAFNGKILAVFANVSQNNQRNIVILDRSIFYPTSGGQQHDTGYLDIEGERYFVVNAEKVGKCVLHILEKPLPGDPDSYVGKEIVGGIDIRRRNQLRANHTGTHIVFAACRKVLGPHVWQNGAKKTVEQAHLDITHYNTLSREEELAIENEANLTILAAKQISKSFMDKAEAEKQYGFRLYQGGIVPGSSVRVVNIEGTDVEACCGTHCDNTSEVGWIKIIKTARISDGIVRLYYVAGEKVLERLNAERTIVNTLSDMWNVQGFEIVKTGERFFTDFKRLDNEVSATQRKLLLLQLRYVVDSPHRLVLLHSDQPNPTIYLSFVPAYAADLKAKDKGVVVLGERFFFALFGNDKQLPIDDLKAILAKNNQKVDLKTRTSLEFEFDKKKKVKTEGILQVLFNGNIDQKAIEDFLGRAGFTSLEL
eukprot:TRINITY_DN1567_c0_g2_i3.p1 TRINITY_DN1567_c0_g2~~TRINITY_DN1567_c0_g2_i3.p1  ORF type:complete len:972 (-),score=341.83 TRINITY_DN1567_c0_g2_i3:72-2987(-)